MTTPARYRVLCVRPRFNRRAPPFIVPLMNEWVEALGLHCDLTIVERDFDYRDVCELAQPDFVVFEDLSPWRPYPLKISNIGAHAGVPRIAFAWADPHDIDRTLFWRLFDDYRVEALLGYAYEHVQQMPELAGCAYSTTLFVDPLVFRDYRLPKIIPISVFGGLRAPEFYPWRVETALKLQRHFPTLVYTHPGNNAVAAHAFTAIGEDYARLLNQSHFSLADTTRLQYVVRKHLEIPAAGSVLVSPDVPPVADYGFVDLENCILGSGDVLRDKIDAVSRDPERYERIRRAGFDLVQTRYTRAGWRTLPDWFACRSTCGPGETVQQVGQFGPFRRVAAGSPRIVGCPVPDNDVTARLGVARSVILGGGSLDAAEAALAQTVGWIPYLVEPCLLSGVIALLRGKPDEAIACFFRPAGVQQGRHANYRLEGEPNVAFDPVEIAWVMLAAHLAANTELLASVRNVAADMRHLALRRMAWLLEGAPAPRPQGLDERAATDRFSVHWLGQEDFPAWCDLIRRVLAANGRPAPAGLARVGASAEALDA
jgi:hypothetical protein